IEFDLYFSFASVHAIAPFHSEGLGHFPTSNFQPTRRSAGGENTEVGTRFLCLLRMFLSLMPYYGAMPGFAKLPQKKNAAILKKRLQRSLNLIQF
uniref:hypothetical protein n=1 Tax=Ruminococcus sp. TaxID=41978 RepID=UPI003FD708ED